MNIKNFFLYLHCAINNISKGVLLGSDIKEHLATIYMESKNIKPKIIVELGVRKGETTKHFSILAKEEKIDFYSVDINDCFGVRSYPEWNFIQSDSVLASKQFKEKKIDVLLIDTSHEYEQTKKEISAWFPLLSKNAIVFFHDTNGQLLYSRADETFGVGNNTNRSVIRAIEEHYKTKLVETEEFELMLNNDLIKNTPTSNGLIIIKRNYGCQK